MHAAAAKHQQRRRTQSFQSESDLIGAFDSLSGWSDDTNNLLYKCQPPPLSRLVLLPSPTHVQDTRQHQTFMGNTMNALNLFLEPKQNVQRTLVQHHEEVENGGVSVTRDSTKPWSTFYYESLKQCSLVYQQQQQQQQQPSSSPSSSSQSFTPPRRYDTVEKQALKPRTIKSDSLESLPIPDIGYDQTTASVSHLRRCSLPKQLPPLFQSEHDLLGGLPRATMKQIMLRSDGGGGSIKDTARLFQALYIQAPKRRQRRISPRTALIIAKRVE